MVDNFRLTVDSNTEIEPLDSVRDVKMRGVSVTENRVANIPQMTGATANANGSAGVVPEPSVSDRDKYLKGDGTWASVQASGSNVQWDQITDEGTHIADITIDNVTTHIYAPEGGGTVTDVVDGDGTSLVDENGVAHVLGEVTDVVDKNNFSLVTNNVAKIPFEVDSTICSPIPDYANITDIEESKSWVDGNETYTWTAPCDCLLVPIINVDVDYVEYTIGDFVLYSSWNNFSTSTVNTFPIGYELIPLAKGTEISIRFLHRYSSSTSQVKYRYIPFKRLQTNRESYPQPYLDYASIRTVSTSDIGTGYTAPTDGVFIAAYSNSSSYPINTYINEDWNKYYQIATGNTPGSSMRLGEGDTIRMETSNLSGSGWFIPFVTTTDPSEVYMPVPDYSDTTTYTDETLPTNIPRGFLFNDNRFTTETTSSLLQTTLSLSTATTNLTLQTICPVPTYETTRYSCVSWFSMSGTETFGGYYPSIIPGETTEGSFIYIPYSTQNVRVKTHYNVDDVVDADGESLVDANGIAHVNAKVKDVLYDGVSTLNSEGVAELYTPRKVTTLPLLDYDNETAISSSSWRDTTVHKWTAPCDCIVYIYDQAGTNNTFVRYTIGNFVYFGTCIGSNHNAPYGLLSNMLPVKKGQEITIQLQGQMMNNFFTKAYYIPYKTVDETAESFPLPYLDHNNRTEIPYATTEYTAPTDGIVLDYNNSKNTIVIATQSGSSTFYGKGGSQYFDCSIPVSASDVVTLGSHSGKYFIPFKRTNNINELVSPIPDYANRVVYSGSELPSSFDKEGFLFACGHDNTNRYSTNMYVTYGGVNITASNYSVDNTYYWKDSFAPIDKTMVRGGSPTTGTNMYYYFIPYSEFNSVYVKDVLVGGASVVGDGSIARIDSLVTDVQLNGESLVENGVAHVTGKVSDVQLDGISILDENAVANIHSPIAIIPSPVLDYANAQYITESATWKDRDEHTWTAPCDCVLWYCLPYSSSDYVKYTVGTFTYETYRTSYGSWNNINRSSYESMFPVAEGTTVTIQFMGTMDTSSNNPRIQYIPYKKATSLQATYALPHIDYANKQTVEWNDPVTDGDLVCRYVAPTDGIFIPNLVLNTTAHPLMKWYVNDELKSVTHTTFYVEYFTNGIVVGKDDVLELYDVDSATSYEYQGTIEFVPFVRTSSLSNIVNPIPDYANAELLDTSDMPSTFDAGYLFNCKNGITYGNATITLTNSESDNIIINSAITSGSSSSAYRFTKNSFLPLNGTETLVSYTDAGDEGGIYYVPYSEAEIVPVLVSDVKVNGTSVVDENGVANITGAGGSTVTVTQILSSGTKIAEIDVDGTTTDLYAPSGGSGGSTVSITRNVLSGENFADITIDGVTTQLYATNTTYSNFVGATSQADGSAGLVPAPTTSDVDKYLKSDGTWATVSGGGGGSTVTITPSLASGIKVADYSIDSTSGSLYAPINADDMTLSAYNALTTAQKNDGTVRFIPEVKQTAYDMSNITEFNGATMTNTSTSNSTTVAWNGSTTASVTDVFYYTTPIDVTSYSSITYDLITTTSYKTSAQYYIHVALSRNAPASSNFDPSQALVDKYYNTINNEYLNETMDVSSLTGELYLVVVASGWNLTIGNITLVPSSVNASQIKYMSETYALVEDMTGATASVDGTNGLVPMPSAGDNTKYLRGDGTWKTPTNTTYSDFTGATSSTGGAHGLVPAPTTSDIAKFLKGDGTWGTPDSGSDVSITQILSSGTKLGTITVDNVDTDLYAPTPTTYSDFVGTDGTAAGTHGLVPAPTASDTNKYLKSDGTWATVSGGGGVSDLDDLSDVDITTPSNGQVLKYNSTSQKWENGTGSGGASDLDDLDDVEITSPTNGQVLKYNSTTQKWENSSGGGSSGKRDIFSDIDTLILSARYATGSLSGSFTFSMSENVDDWSTSATVFNSTGIDLTDYDELEFTVEITDQSDYGAFWLTISGTKYTWGSSDFPTIYENVDSLIKVTESGTYTVDVSDLIGNYYIYLGGTTGKPAVAHGNCANNYNGGIAGTLSSLFGVINGSSEGIVPNPQGEPTDTLNTIEIDGVIYDFAGGGGSASRIVKIYDSESDTTPATLNTNITYIDGIDISNYDLIIAAYSLDRGSVEFPQTIYATGIIDEILNDTDNDWVVAGYGERWAMLDIGATSFRVTAGSYGIYKLFVVKLGGSGNANIEELTQGEYNVLPSSQKENGTMYLTHDGDEEVDLTVRMVDYTSTSGTASAVGSLNANFLAWHAFASEDDFDANLNGEYWAGNGEGAYLQFDFANAVSITKVAYASYQYSSFDLMYSTDGTTYTKAETLTQADQGTTNPTKQDYTLSESIANVISIRFVCNGVYNIGALHIYGNDGNLTPNRIYLNGRKYAEVSDSETLSPIGLTQDEYDLLPSLQKEDTSKLYLVNDTGASAINMYYVTKYSETNVTITNYEHSTVLGWSSGNAIGQTWYYLSPIDVTNIDTIRYDITTGSRTYGSVNGHNDVRNLGFGLRDTAPSAMTLINNMNYDLYNEYHDVNDLNKTLIGEELDVSELTGEYYLIGTGAGWNATISNVVLVSGDGINKSCIYWNDTVYGESKLGSSNIETEIEKIYQSPSDAAEQTITLSAPMTDFDLLILNTNMGAFIQPIDTIEEEAYLGGGNGSSYIWYSFDLTTPTILTKAYQGGGVWIRNIQGVKFGSDDPVGKINYSTDEQEVGTWIDDSTVYQKTYTYSNGSPTTDWVLLDNTINKSDNFLVKIEGSWIIGNTSTSGNHGYHPLFVNGNFQSSGDVASPRLRLEDDGLYINVSQSTYGVQVWATVQYTK